MKPRKPLPRRKKYLERNTKPIARSTRPIAKRGATKAKKEKRYAKYLSSAAWKAKKRAVRERSGGQCERFVDEVYGSSRCMEDATSCNHRTYARFGNELLEDLEDLCQFHHDEWSRTHQVRFMRR